MHPIRDEDDQTVIRCLETLIRQGRVNRLSAPLQKLLTDHGIRDIQHTAPNSAASTAILSAFLAALTPAERKVLTTEVQPDLPLQATPTPSLLPDMDMPEAASHLFQWEREERRWSTLDRRAVDASPTQPSQSFLPDMNTPAAAALLKEWESKILSAITPPPTTKKPGPSTRKKR